MLQENKNFKEQEFKLNDRIANLDLVFSFLKDNNLSCQLREESIYAKMYCRYCLRYLRKESGFKNKWNSLYPEINGHIMVNPYIPVKLKIYHLLVNLNLGFIA